MEDKIQQSSSQIIAENFVDRENDLEIDEIEEDDLIQPSTQNDIESAHGNDNDSEDQIDADL